MRGRKTASIPVEMEHARQRLEDWRSTQIGRARIPENMWTVAVELARQHGVHQTARTLRLDYVKLKKLVESAVPAQSSLWSSERSSGVTPATFVELITPQATSFCECNIELEGPRGKIRIQTKGASLPDLGSLSRALWGQP